MTVPVDRGARRPYEPPRQSLAGQLADALVLLGLVFGALYAPVLLGWTSPTASTTEVLSPTWESLHQNAAMAAQWEKLGFDPAQAAPLITSRFDYHIDPVGLAVTALVLIAYLAFLLVVSDREYREVIAEKFDDPPDRAP